MCGDIAQVLSADSSNSLGGFTSGGRRESRVATAPSDGWCVWLDYWSIPQQSGENQMKAIYSIGSYSECAMMMWVLVPDVVHSDTGEMLNFETWRSRGWCRLEQFGFILKDYRLGQDQHFRTAIFGTAF